jgi:chaperonin GroEL (HSP60 family)
LPVQVSSGDEIRAVATISSGNDEAIGALIAEALEKVGKDGVLTIETSQGLETSVDVTEGMEIDRGYISPQFITNQEKMLVEFQDALVLVTDHKLETVKQIIPILDKVRLMPCLVVHMKAAAVSGGVCSCIQN